MEIILPGRAEQSAAGNWYAYNHVSAVPLTNNSRSAWYKACGIGAQHLRALEPFTARLAIDNALYADYTVQQRPATYTTFWLPRVA